MLGISWGGARGPNCPCYPGAYGKDDAGMAGFSLLCPWQITTPSL